MIKPQSKKDSLQSRYGSLRDIPDADLYKTLQENEKTDVAVLACICSEILRRIIEQEYKSIQADDDDD